MKRWFLLLWILGVIASGAIAYSASSAARSLSPLPDPHSSAYKGSDDMETLLYVRDVGSQLQKEHQLILDKIEEIEAKVGQLEKNR